MHGLSQQAGGQIGLGVDRQEPVQSTDAALDQVGDSNRALCGDFFAADDQIEHGIIDQRLDRIQKTRMNCRKLCQACLPLRLEIEPSFDRGVQLLELARELVAQVQETGRCLRR